MGGYYREEAKNSGVDIRRFAQQQADMAATLDRVDQTTRIFSTDLANMIRVVTPTNRSETQEVVAYAFSDKWDPSDYKSNDRLKQDVVDENNETDSIVRRIKNSLFFESMDYRETAISEQHARTFEWIFREPRRANESEGIGGELLWDSFPDWLANDDTNRVFWVTGKPGSGKSTLLKFIAYDPRFRRLLAQWAGEGGGAEVLTGCYFSWNAGVHRLQKTHEGLLRTILFEVITQKRALVPQLFPRRWLLSQLFGYRVDLPEIEYREVLRSFKALVAAMGETLRLALVIDGLDEFEEGGHSELVALLHEANTSPWVKICASSRPWNVFRDAYAGSPMLRLENLTRDDIDLYVREQLQLSTGFQEFQVIDPEMAATVVEDIVEKSAGVFLWVSIVTALLAKNFMEGDNRFDLRATVDSIPSEISEIFTYIWQRTNVRYRQEALQYFQIKATCAKWNLNLYCLTFWLGDRMVPVDMRLLDMTPNYINMAVKSLARRLVSRTGGILEISGSLTDPEEATVDFMHRTAAEWVSENWNTISLPVDEDFDPNLWLLKGEVLRMMRQMDQGEFRKASEPWQFWKHIRTVTKLATTVKDTAWNRKTLSGALDRLDGQLGKTTRLRSKTGTFHIADAPSFNERTPNDIGNHWCNNPGFKLSPKVRGKKEDSLFESPLNLLLYTARLPVAPYIKFKLEQDRAAFSVGFTASGAGFLENLVFGPHYQDVSIGTFNEPPAFGLERATRSELLELLLREGVCLDQVERTRSHLNIPSPVTVTPPGEYDEREIKAYWDTMTKILDNHISGSKKVAIEPMDCRVEQRVMSKGKETPRAEVRRFILRLRDRLRGYLT